MSQQHLRYLMLTYCCPSLPRSSQLVDKSLKEDAASFSCLCSFDQAVMVAQWYYPQLKTLETGVRTLPWESSGHVTTQSMSPQHLRSQVLSTANLCYQEALNWRKWTKGGCNFLLLSMQFFIELSW